MADPKGREATNQVELPSTEKPKRTKLQNVSADLLRRKVLVDAKRKREKDEGDNDEFVYFVKCSRVPYNEETGEGHVALWLTEKPISSRIHPGMWHSLHHQAGEPWTDSVIPCQECFVEGEARAWPPHLRAVRREDGSFDFVFAADRKLIVGKMTRESLGERQTKIGAAVGEEK